MAEREHKRKESNTHDLTETAKNFALANLSLNDTYSLITHDTDMLCLIITYLPSIFHCPRRMKQIYREDHFPEKFNMVDKKTQIISWIHKITQAVFTTKHTEQLTLETCVALVKYYANSWMTNVGRKEIRFAHNMEQINDAFDW